MTGSRPELALQASRSSEPASGDSSSTDAPDACSGICCPICEASDPIRFAEGQDRFFRVARGQFRLLRCRQCRCIFQYPMPQERVLERYYPERYWWKAAPPDASRLRRALSRLEEVYRRLVLRDHVRFLVRSASKMRQGIVGRTLLDIGCGNGAFLSGAGRRGFVPCGLDVSSEAVELARNQGLDVRVGPVGCDAWAGSQFDFVTMFHIVEHLADPCSALRWVQGLLAPGGSLIVQVPNVDSFQARLFGRRWYGLDVPRHLVNFSPESIACLFRRAGFEILAFSHFSFRDNAAALASSLVPSFDPMGARVRFRDSAVVAAARELGYLGLVVLAFPFALAESWMGAGATFFVHARRRQG